MSTIVEVAKCARVSIATVSNVIRGTRCVSTKLEERVRAAILKLDYHPNEIARGLKVKQTRMLVMIVPDITNPFFPEIIRGAEDTAFARGYFLVTANTDERVEREQRTMLSLRAYRVAGILLASAPGEDAGHIRASIRAGMSIVCLDRLVARAKTDAVLLDNVRGARDCVQHLLRSGYPTIAIITGPLTLQTGRERLRGYENALRMADIKIDPKLIFEGDFREESGYRLAKEIISMCIRPSAILVCNGVMTLGVLRAFEELGVRCPKDIGLATFDDLSIDRAFHPHLTAVVQPSYDIGARAAAILMDRIEGKLPARTKIYRVLPTLIVRESTRPRLL